MDRPGWYPPTINCVAIYEKLSRSSVGIDQDGRKGRADSLDVVEGNLSI